MRDVAICTPWIETNCVWRARSRDFTAVHWWNLAVPVVYGGSCERPLNRAQARNRAAENTDAEVLFFSDADMWVDEQRFLEAVNIARTTGKMVLAYTDHMRLNRWSSQRVYEGNHAYQGQSVKGCSSGCFAIRRDVYERIGGHDERFRGWGGEDRAFMFACMTLVGVERIEGTSYHLFHPRGKDQATVTTERREGLELAQRYKRLSGVTARSGIVRPTKDARMDVDGMWALIQEPGGPLHSRAVGSTVAAEQNV